MKANKLFLKYLFCIFLYGLLINIAAFLEGYYWASADYYYHGSNLFSAILIIMFLIDWKYFTKLPVSMKLFFLLYIALEPFSADIVILVLILFENQTQIFELKEEPKAID